MPNKPGGPWVFMFHTMACAFIFWMEVHIPRDYAAKYVAVCREFDDVQFCMTPRMCALVLLWATKSIWNSKRLVVMDAAFSGVAVLVSIF